MNPREARDSRGFVGQVLIYGIPFAILLGVILAFTNDSIGIAVLAGAVTGGIVFGVVMALVSKRSRVSRRDT